MRPRRSHLQSSRNPNISVKTPDARSGKLPPHGRHHRRRRRGTNTDAVRLCGGRVAARTKVPTTPDIGSGLLAALERVRGRGSVERVHVGPTAFTNAIVTRRELAPAAALRVGAPASESLPPMIDWPPDLRAASGKQRFFAHGGREYDGRPITPLDRSEIERIGEAAARLLEARAEALQRFVSAHDRGVDPALRRSHRLPNCAEALLRSRPLRLCCWPRLPAVGAGEPTRPRALRLSLCQRPWFPLHSLDSTSGVPYRLGVHVTIASCIHRRCKRATEGGRKPFARFQLGPFVSVILAFLIGATDGCRGGGPRPNLVLVLIDTLRADHLGIYGYPRPTSPELDRLAESCTVFEQAQATAPWTASSLVSIMTSLLPDAHGVQGFPIPEVLPESVTTLAERLASRGYATAAFTEGGYAKRGFGLERGFETYPLNPGDEAGFRSNLTHPSRLRSNVDRSLAWLAKRGEEPFFLFFHTYEVHTPLRPPAKFVRRFRADYSRMEEQARIRRAIESWSETGTIAEDDAFLIRRHLEHHPGSSVQGEISFQDLMRAHPSLGVQLHRGARGREYLEWFSDLYDAEIAYTDEELSRLWASLAGRRQRAPTILVILSDHGEALGDHGELLHGWGLHEELMRVALLICGMPKEFAPRRVPQLVSTLDLVPTILDLLDVPHDASAMQGRSLLPLLRGGEAGRPVFGQSLAVPGEERRHHSVRSARWRLITDTATKQSRLYDRNRDGGETRDVASEHADVVAELEDLLGSQIADSRQRARGQVLRPAAVDDQMRAELRALGYLDSDGDQPGDR